MSGRLRTFHFCGLRNSADGRWIRGEAWAMRKPGNLLILAIVIGAVGAALVYRQLASLRSEIESTRQAPNGTVDVVVASETIPLGTRIQSKWVKVVPWPREIGRAHV